MTVKELIERLQQEDPTAQVVRDMPPIKIGRRICRHDTVDVVARLRNVHVIDDGDMPMKFKKVVWLL